MPRVAPAVPAESDLLCESCGYTLNGLPADARCPECGTPVGESDPATRGPSAWERRPGLTTFWRDAAAVVLRPTRFFRSLSTRGDAARSSRFALRQTAMSSLLFAAAAGLHAKIALPPVYSFEVLFDVAAVRLSESDAVLLGGVVVAAFVTAGAVVLVTHAAAKLTTIEGTYRGLRLPYRAVLRVLHFHAADYLPVALLAVITTGGYWALTRAGVLGYETLVTYLYVLSGEVVLSAGYLFNTYWRAMRATMYANA